jgi:hypothetical protein
MSGWTCSISKLVSPTDLTMAIFSGRELTASSAAQFRSPPMQGGEYLQLDALIALWQATERALEIELSESNLPLQDFLKARNSRWRLVGRVHLNLAENRRDPDYPFAFTATYASGLSANGVLRHLQLGQALREYAGIGDKAKLGRPLTAPRWTPASRPTALFMSSRLNPMLPAASPERLPRLA